MESDSGSIKSSGGTWGVVVTLSLVVLWYARLYLYRRPNSNSRLPTGPRGLPLVGNLLSLHPDLHSYFAGLAHTYGPIYKLRLGTKLAVVITSPSLAREVLRDHDVIFANRDIPAAGRAATYGGADIAWRPYGAEWRMLRRVCVVNMLSKATLDSVQDLRRKQVRKMVGFFYGRVGSRVNVGEQIFLNTMHVVTDMLWGGTVQEEAAGEGREFREVISELTGLLGKPNVSDFYPGLARFDLQGVVKQMDGIVKRFDEIFERVIDQRLRMMKEGIKEKEGSTDFLSFLLRLKDEGDSKTPLTIIHIKALFMDMITAGTDTSSNTIEFAISEVMNKPEVLEKINQELEAVVGKENIVEESHIHKLPYLYAVMKETLRLHPVVPLLIPHCPSETCTVGGYTIPKGSQIFVNVWAIHRDSSSWENPLEFDPTRFLDSEWDYTGNDFRYFPFGSGRRICAGIAMAERMVMHALATLLHSFDWKMPQGEELDLSEKFGIVLKKKMPLVAIPTPRLSDPALYI
ncbi:flavonoid 3'-monooxygenase CYP75B137-like [Argentina anserina]|uniref:flavonoid 3'-monooxygenase CYP75B137-like n=1 Tax=Argentina anserina TaxID=57926 RepID=UPI0021763D05|nr:flavonoid 3'-monooxygenase CYP75B137-like [Potentilla anserina]